MTNPLHANDKPGQYPLSWYQTTVSVPPLHPELRSHVSADVCVIGAGYTGLSTALHLVERGYDVSVLEAHRVGWGASGRNGGQVGSGHSCGQDTLEKELGFDQARALWSIAEEAKSTVRGLIEKHAIQCDYRPGVAWLGQARGSAQTANEMYEHLTKHYGYDSLELLDDQALGELIGSLAFKGGVIDWGAGHLNPLKYVFGLAEAARKAGVKIFESSEVEAIDDKSPSPVRVRTANGNVTAAAVVIACNGYLGQLSTDLAARVMPINSFMIATEPLGEDRARQVLSRDIAVYDDRFVVNYFRMSPDHRLLFGGRESYGVRFPSDLAGKVKKRMLTIFPELADVRVEHAWGGTLGITRNRMPDFARMGTRLYSASGYSGHGVAMATMAGKVVANAISGDLERFDVLSRVPIGDFPGGRHFRRPLLNLALLWFAFRDRFM